MIRALAAAALALSAAAGAQEPADEGWREAAVATPPYPARENLLEFYVGPTATARFLIDGASLSVGEDGVIRFALVIETPGGATNVSFEGMRCGTRERRIYALGRNDRSWHPVKEVRWIAVRSAGPNSPYAALLRSYFCPDGDRVRDAAEARRALTRKESNFR